MQTADFKLLPADYYEYTDELFLVTCYFNPSNYQTKYKNYTAFRERIDESGLHLLTVECAFGDADFTLPSSSDVLQIRCNSIMWQKERLLNIAIQNLPANAQKVAWLDCDVLFTNGSWAIETAKQLDNYVFVQPFKRAFRLPRDAQMYDGFGESFRGFCYTLELDPNIIDKGIFSQHGHTGFAWAGRREILEKYGLYDSLISGSSDHMMGHAMYGDWMSSCVRRIFQNNAVFMAHFEDWATRIYAETQGSIGHVNGALLHLWHGETEDRRYMMRHDELMKQCFDPLIDIRIGEAGAWEWNTNKPTLHKWAHDYFSHRREDG